MKIYSFSSQSVFEVLKKMLRLNIFLRIITSTAGLSAAIQSHEVAKSADNRIQEAALPAAYRKPDAVHFSELYEEINFVSTEDEILSLVGNLINRTDPATIGFLVDSIFLEHFSHQKFVSSHRRSQTFLLPIKDYEVFDDGKGRQVNEQAQEMLSAMKAVYCDFYVILITNGIQMKALLQFIDNHRLLNVVAKLVVLHDYRILTSDMNFIWKRFVNVIFLRRCDTPGVWYELSTVPFPAPIEEILFPRIVNYWSPEFLYRWRHNTFEEKHEKSLQGETLKVVVLPHTPTVYKKAINENETEYSGLEIELIECLSVLMNFTVDYYETPDSDRVKWGEKVGEQNYSGLLGEMDQANADIALGDLHYTMLHLNVMDLSVPYNTKCMTFITPELLSDNSWQTLVSPFSVGMWIGVLLSLSIVGVIFFLFSKCYVIIKPKDVKAERNSYFGRDFFDDFSSCIIYTYSMVLLVSLPRLPLRWSVRVLTGWWWIYCVLLVVAYRAALTSILANPTPRVTIDTIQELANSWAKCGAWGEQNRNFFTQADDESAQKIGEKLEHVDDSEAAVGKSQNI